MWNEGIVGASRLRVPKGGNSTLEGALRTNSVEYPVVAMGKPEEALEHLQGEKEAPLQKMWGSVVH